MDDGARENLKTGCLANLARKIMRMKHEYFCDFNGIISEKFYTLYYRNKENLKPFS